MSLYQGTLPKPGAVDFEQRARLSAFHFDAGVDPVTAQPYFAVCHGDPVFLLHDWPDFGDLTARYFEAACMAADMTGETPASRDRLRDNLLSYFEADGLNYRQQCLHARRLAEMFDQSRTLYALVSACMADDDPALREALRGLVDGLDRIAEKKDGARYLPGKAYCDGEWLQIGFSQSIEGYFVGPLIRPLVKAAEVLNYEPALDLAADFARYVTDVAPVIEEDGFFSGHSHSRLSTAAGLYACGKAAGNRDWMERARNAWRFARTYAGPAGFVPEAFPRKGEERDIQLRCETCSIMDYVDLGILLAEEGDAAMWAAMERTLRGHLIESQAARADWGNGPTDEPRSELRWKDRVPERMLGGFAGWSSMDRFFGRTFQYQASWVQGEADPSEYVGKTRLFQNCCSPAGLKALHLLWSRAVARSAAGLEVRMLVNRATPEVAVRARREGEDLKVRVRVRDGGPLNLRAPDWAPQSLSFDISGEKRVVRARDGWWVFEDLPSGAEVSARWPLKQWHEEVTLRHSGYPVETYNVTFAGDALLKAEYRGGGPSPEQRAELSVLHGAYPLYERDPADLYTAAEPRAAEAAIAWF